MLELDHMVFKTHERFRLRGLPKAYDGRLMSFEVCYWLADGKITAQSRGQGDGSVRYYTFTSLDQAFSTAMAWGKRKLAAKNAPAA